MMRIYLVDIWQQPESKLMKTFSFLLISLGTTVVLNAGAQAQPSASGITSPGFGTSPAQPFGTHPTTPATNNNGIGAPTTTLILTPNSGFCTTTPASVRCGNLNNNTFARPL